MFELFQAMLWPILAAVVLPPILVYFGLQTLRRGNPTAALAFPQLAILGNAVAAQMQFSGWRAFACSLAFALFAATAASLPSGKSASKWQNASMAVLFLIAAPLTVLPLKRQSDSIEEVKHI